MKKVKILLLTEVAGLGGKGEIKEVNRGYAENYLIPRGLARLVDAEVANLVQAQKVKEENLARKRRLQAEEAKKLIESKSLVLKVKAGKGGKIFGSVTAKDISEALLKQLSVKIDKREIEVGTIKALGKYSYLVRLDAGLKAEGEVLVEGDT